MTHYQALTPQNTSIGIFSHLGDNYNKNRPCCKPQSGIAMHRHRVYSTQYKKLPSLAGKIRSRVKETNRRKTILAQDPARRRAAKPLKIIKRRMTPPGIVTRVQNATSFAKQWILEKKDYIAKRHPIHEGPMSLRAVTFIGGLAMSIASFIGVCYLNQAAGRPVVYVVQLYQMLFGFITVIIEAKHLSTFESLQQWMSNWFPFLRLPLGRGGLYVFMGVLGGALWQDSLPIAVIGLLMTFLGLVHILVYFGGTDHIRCIGLELTQVQPRQSLLQFPVTSERKRDKKIGWQYNPYEKNHHYNYMTTYAPFEYPNEYLQGVRQAQQEHLLDQMDQVPPSYSSNAGARLYHHPLLSVNEDIDLTIPPNTHLLETNTHCTTINTEVATNDNWR